MTQFAHHLPIIFGVAWALVTNSACDLGVGGSSASMTGADSSTDDGDTGSASQDDTPSDKADGGDGSGGDESTPSDTQSGAESDSEVGDESEATQGDGSQDSQESDASSSASDMGDDDDDASDDDSTSTTGTGSEDDSSSTESGSSDDETTSTDDDTGSTSDASDDSEGGTASSTEGSDSSADDSETSTDSDSSEDDSESDTSDSTSSTSDTDTGDTDTGDSSTSSDGGDSSSEESTTSSEDSGPGEECGVENLLDRASFAALFPDRNPFYTYEDLVAAAAQHPGFATTGGPEVCARELAAFLGNVARETGELIYIEQIQKDVYCQSSASCPCAPGKRYFGRGPIQLSWNYNYCAAGQVLGLDLRADPDLVARDATVAWSTAMWFWMTQSGAGRMTPHEAITEGHGFGETIRSINGAQECNGAWPDAVAARVAFFRRYCGVLGVDPGANQSC